MDARTKRVLIICGIIVLAFLVMNYFKNGSSLKQIMNKLDSTQVMLDSAQQKIQSSKSLIHNLQANVDSYSMQVLISDARVTELEEKRQIRENNFLRKIGDSKQNYESIKDQLYQHRRTFWPEIIIDTSHYQRINAN